jgi:hypothetical protein
VVERPELGFVLPKSSNQPNCEGRGCHRHPINPVVSNKTANARRVIVREEINFTRDVEGKENKTQNDERGLASGLYIHEISLPLASARLTRIPDK